MNVRDLGQGPAILLLHGTPSPAADLMPLAERLAARYRVLVPDLPGYGGTPAGDLSFATTSRRIQQLLEERCQGTLHAIVGFSGGAYRALRLVLRERVEARAICALAALATLDDDKRATFRHLATAIETQPASLGSAELRTTFSETMLSPAWRAEHPADAAQVADWLGLMTPADFAAELRAMAEIPDLRAELRELRAALYLRVGEIDVATPAAASAEIASLVPHAELDIVPSRGHALLVEDAAETIRAVIAFVDQVPT